MLSDNGQLYHFRERTIRKFWDEPRGETVFRSGLNDQRELRGRVRHFHGRLRRGVLCAVDDVTPADKLFQGPRIEAKFFLRDCGNEFCAGLEVRLVIHVRARVFAELLGVGGREESALVMVKPPGNFRGIRILEVDDNIFIAVEEAFIPGLRGAVRHAGEAELGGGVEALAVKAVKKSSGGGSVKATIVETEPDPGHDEMMAPFYPSIVPDRQGQNS